MTTPFDATDPLRRAARRLVDLRVRDEAAASPGRGELCWEGEDVWNTMLASQHALAWHVMERPFPAGRREALVQQLRAERNAEGLWGLHPWGPSSLFVSTLAYVAARTLGVKADDPMLAEARRLFAREDVRAIPSWGKAWLAILNLYEWEGVNAVPPEAWLLPERFPLHPANYYCHTRLIYMGMASVSGLKLKARRTALTDALREELYPGRAYEDIDFASAKGLLREADLWAPPTKVLQSLYAAVNVFEKAHAKAPAFVRQRVLGALRRRCLAELRERMRWELRSTDYTCLSPVNGLLFMLVLWAWDHDDPDVARQAERFEGWVWTGDATHDGAAEHGARVAGARSATWDTSFALQALSAARPLLDGETRAHVDGALREGLDWLLTQQIPAPPIDDAATYRRQYRVDPTGGFCFAGVWHGWPVSDCTAEALSAFLEAPRALFDVDASVAEKAVRFLLQCQNEDGGFGSYESRKSPLKLEWMNPAEMFGDSMTELSYFECTASNLVALCEVRERFPKLLRREVDRAIARAERYLRAHQNEDGSWEGAWGVAYVYGTMFGVRGLLAAGADASDPAIAKARRFLAAHQRADGSWGEHWRTCLTNEYEDLGHGHVTQTAWALWTLLEAGHEDLGALSKAAAWLAAQQDAEGDFPVQEYAGVFFRTALIEYRLYRRFFPVWALARYQERVAEALPRASGTSADAGVEHVLDRARDSARVGPAE
ncbi:MAG TPA: prenyltransferase/squalene oxidase repeat-containing protein [Polyangiaceae bacterium LLY-WYZ-15_(1-7)]|nr:squalene cyclase [Sandaracinus sp.]HJK95289.1 prenyltransferase/squalene oxidase repeat-containing protein [Polyangiaceae bacterium LLY-WYZ-15_(1-7)]MBJ74011.1 squalene cyclase [Sandaracinus sp.]HJL03778.1 prenyltransferase/squalene oxidase repeat-containing protein [Polyangiaceae bacterium LLY-WYZ-15_(1-7)]HJL09833.1 prenyltransferase/squalene oxidase repeat-containing protein [Polyangiaceae bacterium LLY-WYZ-15_(1-7)]